MEWAGDGKSDCQPFPGLGPGRQLSAVAVVTVRQAHCCFPVLRTEEYLLCLFLPALIASGPHLGRGTDPQV